MRPSPILCSAMLLATSAIEPAVAASSSAQYFSRRGVTVPFSTAVRAGDLIFVSGQIGAAPNGVIPPDIETGGRYALDSVADALKHAGATLDDVVRCQVMMVDMNKWAAFNKVYATYFKPGRLPARSAMGVTALAFGAQIEIECVAYKPMAASK